MSLRDSICQIIFSQRISKHQNGEEQSERWSGFSSTDLKCLIPFIGEDFLDFKRTAALKDLLQNIKVDDIIKKNALRWKQHRHVFPPWFLFHQQLTNGLKLLLIWKQLPLKSGAPRVLISISFQEITTLLVVKPGINTNFMAFIKSPR